jgi:uncharacterized protein involved in exopolysaccharide biosynthesis
MNTEKDKNFDSSYLLLLIWKWRKHIIIVMAATVVISSVISLLIREKYKSTAIVFPAKANSVSLGKLLNPSQSVMQFGEEEEAEAMLQILNSADVRNHIIEKYNLMQHYDIDTSAKYKYTNLLKEYEENVKCSRTRFGSVEIQVLDYDPDTAALIANDIVNLLDSAKNRMLRERAQKAFEIIEKEYLNLKREVAILIDTLTALSRMGVIGSATGEAALTEAYGNAIKERNTVLADYIKKQLDITRQYQPIYVSFADELEIKQKLIDERKAIYDQARSDATATFTHKFVVEPAVKAEKKSYPVRWLIVFISTASSFFLMIFLILVIEKIKELNKLSAKK